ncbi:MAG TPA: phosphotransferase [Roseiflexaceae bacterium]|nr:phosphotransferase [Roseiflexaceae bacterium]
MLAQFGIDESALLGSGGESQVYALDPERVLRIYKAGMATDYIDARHDLLALIAARNPPFLLAQPLERGTIDNRAYVIERRMHGSDLAVLLPTLSGGQRRHALHSYLDTAAQIGSVTFADRPYGELLPLPASIHTQHWPDYLRARAAATLALSRGDLAADLPDAERVLQQLDADLQRLGDPAQRTLVHGDYFPGNVFVDHHFTTYGVGDFGYTTLVGDPRMDLAGALAFLELTPGYQPEDSRLLSDALQARGGDHLLDVLQIYRRYYAVYFSLCKDSDPPTYAWCVGVLRAA